MENAFLFIHIAILLLVVRFAWKMFCSTMKDIMRDRLIELKDEWLEYCSNKKIDSHIVDEVCLTLDKRMEMASKYDLFFISRVAKKIKPETIAAFKSIDEAFFRKCGDETAKTIKSIRERSISAVMIYWVCSSVLCILICVYYLIDIFSSSLATSIRKRFDRHFGISEISVDGALGTYAVS